MIYGSYTRVAQGKESTWGTKATATHASYFNSFNLEEQIAYSQMDERVGIVGTPKQYIQSKNTTGGLTVLGRQDDIGYLMYLLLGKDTYSSSHTLTIDHDNPNTIPSATFYEKLGDGTVYAFTGTVCSGITLSQAQGGTLTCQATLQGKQKTVGSASDFPATVVPSNQEPLRFIHGDLSIAGTSICDITSVTATLTNTISQFQTLCTDVYFNQPYRSQLQATFAMDILFGSVSKDFFTKWDQNTDVLTTNLTFSNGSSNSVVVSFPKQVVTAYSQGVTNDDAVSANITLSAYTETGDDIVTATITNNNAYDYDSEL